MSISPKLRSLLREEIRKIIMEEELPEKRFRNPVLNMRVTYKTEDWEDRENIVGNLLRLPDDHPGRQAAERMIPPEGSEERERMNNELGDEGDGAGTDAPQPNAIPSRHERPSDEEDDEETNEEERNHRRKVTAMYQNDPAMRRQLEKESQVLRRLYKN